MSRRVGGAVFPLPVISNRENDANHRLKGGRKGGRELTLIVQFPAGGGRKRCIDGFRVARKLADADGTDAAGSREQRREGLVVGEWKRARARARKRLSRVDGTANNLSPAAERVSPARREHGGGAIRR